MVDEAEDTTGDDRVDWRNPRASAIYIGSALYFGLSGLVFDPIWSEVLIWVTDSGAQFSPVWSDVIEVIAYALIFVAPLVVLAWWTSEWGRKRGRPSFVEMSRSKRFHMGDMIVWFFLVGVIMVVSVIAMRAAVSEFTLVQPISFFMAMGCWPMIVGFLRHVDRS